MADENAGKFPSKLGLLGLFTESMNPTFDIVGDAMQKPHRFSSHRTKVIHSVGGHAKVTMKAASGHPFTGVFKGFTEGIVRLSSANKPEFDGGLPLTPGISMKFLRDGIDSGNMVAMYGVNGQPGKWNFFENEFRNHIVAAEGAALKLVSKKFSTVTDWIQEVGLSDMAMFGEDGKKVDHPVYPWRMDFTPNPSVKKMFSND